MIKQKGIHRQTNLRPTCKPAPRKFIHEMTRMKNDLLIPRTTTTFEDSYPQMKNLFMPYTN